MVASTRKGRLTLRDAVAILRDSLPDLRKRYGVASLSVFGSFVRGQQRDRSDVDILVEFDSPPTFFEFLQLEEHLQQLLGTRVDLVMKSALKPRIGERILAEAVSV